MFTDPEGLYFVNCAPNDLECYAEVYGNEKEPVEPNTPRHRARNIFNRCPWKEPNTQENIQICVSKDDGVLTDKEGNIWEREYITPIFYHCGFSGGYRTYRNLQNGWQCSYLPDGTLDDWTHCMGTYDYVPPSSIWDIFIGHREKDVAPHGKDDSYEGGLTQRY